MQRRELFGLLAAPLSAPLFAQGAVTTVFIVRHGDRDHGKDPDEPINALGMERAEELARVLGDAGITTIFTTELKRTQMTAGPLAKKRNVQVTVVPQAEVVQLQRALEDLPAGSAALVVSHSDKVPMLVKAMGQPAAAIESSEYDRLTILTLEKGKAIGVKTLRYGRASKP